MTGSPGAATDQSSTAPTGRPRRSLLIGLIMLAVVVIVMVAVVLMLGHRGSAGGDGSTAAKRIVVSKLAGPVPGGRPAFDLREGDADALRNPTLAPDVAAVTPVLISSKGVVVNQRQVNATIYGSTADYLAATDRTLAAGSTFSAQQERPNARVAVLGSALVASLFGGDAHAALGATVRIDRGSFQVIGVLARTGQDDDTVIMPLAAARVYVVGDATAVSQLIVEATSADAVDSALDEVHRVLDNRHNVRDQSRRDYTAVVG